MKKDRNEWKKSDTLTLSKAQSARPLEKKTGTAQQTEAAQTAAKSDDLRYPNADEIYD
ncbi:hypothetical protein [Numidum massiliense]|uniref:hypothetical protein n=1 Tax=Numidum massiliense TaxID=1522315 RepID=UPI0012F908DE|nr:hypothetical protein [Numidum massiliense]